MRIIYRNQQSIEEFWKSYWERCPKDPDRISDKTIYPLFPVDEYVTGQMKILEVGCGMGRVFKHYFNEGCSITGLEYDRNCLVKLQSENVAFPLVCADARHLPFRNESADMVMAFGLLSSIESGYDDAQAELHRVLRDEGWICASVACHTMLRRAQNLLGWVEHTLSKIRGRKSQRHFFARGLRPQEWARELQEAGFKVVRVEPTHSRVLFWQFLPFLRKRSESLDLSLARDGDIGYNLNTVGEKLFQFMRRKFPWFIAVGVVCIGRKVTALSNQAV